MLRCIYSGNSIGAEGATALASALERNSTLQHLYVMSECHGDARVYVVCAVRCFGLCCDVIGRERTVCLCFVTCVATHASGNGIGAGGATALASALERNSTLQHLDIISECHGDAGVSCVRCAMLWMMMRCDWA
jgi:hypothetical protein